MKDKPLSALFRLNWTPGDITLAVWKIIGSRLRELHGAIIRDSKRQPPMYMISMEHYVKERTTQIHKTQSKAKPKPDPKGMPQVNKWNVSYIQAVKGPQPK